MADIGVKVDDRIQLAESRGSLRYIGHSLFFDALLTLEVQALYRIERGYGSASNGMTSIEENTTVLSTTSVVSIDTNRQSQIG